MHVKFRHYKVVDEEKTEKGKNIDGDDIRKVIEQYFSKKGKRDLKQLVRRESTRLEKENSVKMQRMLSDIRRNPQG